MARTSADADEQALQQMLSASPWDHQVVRQGLAEHTSRQLAPAVGWIIDDTAFAKQGKHSVGVARQYSGRVGGVTNCQVAISLHFCSGEASVPLDFALYLPQEWTQDRVRLEAAGVPPSVVFKEKWRLALDLIDGALQWRVTRGVVNADSAYGDTTEFRKELIRRNLKYMMQVSSIVKGWSESVEPKLRQPLSPTGRPPTNYDYSRLPKPRSVKEVALALPAKSWKIVTWREGSRGPMTSRFSALTFRPSRGYTDGAPPQPEQWLVIEWPLDEDAPTGYWFSNLPQDCSLPSLVYQAKIRWRIEMDYRELKDELGLDQFEGRSWIGWHHHVTLTMMAHAFLTLERLREKKEFWVEFADPT
jgi:SRSO17 transposase